MKKMILFGSSLCICVFCLAQNVGIGTISPPDKLTVTTVSGNYGLVHTDGTVSVGTWVGNGAGYIGTKSVHPLRFFTANGTTQMTLLTNGNFGIGTLVPATKLSIQTPNNTDGFSHTSDGGIILKESVGGVSAAFGTFSNHTLRLVTNGVAAINIDPAGKVGIGVADPAFLMEVADRIRIRSGVYPSTAGVGMNNPANSATVAFMGIKQVDQVGFYGNVSGWGLTMNTNTGDVAAGNLNPVAGYKLSVGGGAYVNGPVYGTGDLEVNGIAQVGGNISSGGKVTAGSYSTGGWSMSGAGSFFFISGGGMQMELNDGTIDTYTTSDRNAKKDIKALPDVLPRLMKLNPAQYYYKWDSASTQLSTGFIAQEVQTLFPYAVHTKKDPGGEAMLSVAYRHFAVIAIKAIQEQQAIINLQQSKMESMDRRLIALEKLLNVKMN
jgi:hypothetical protein